MQMPQRQSRPFWEMKTAGASRVPLSPAHAHCSPAAQARYLRCRLRRGLPTISQYRRNQAARTAGGSFCPAAKLGKSWRSGEPVIRNKCGRANKWLVFDFMLSASLNSLRANHAKNLEETLLASASDLVMPLRSSTFPARKYVPLALQMSSRERT